MAIAMVKPFAVEQWMDKYETTAKYNLAETCSASISLDDLHDLSDNKTTGPLNGLSTKLTYGAIRGSDALRTNLANLYSSRAQTRFGIDNFLVTPGAIAANLITLYALVGKGDHIVCQYPTYQQLYEVPASLGAEISLWKCKEENNWLLDPDELKSLLQPNTKLIIINNPQNPTGAIIPRLQLETIVKIAQVHNLVILSDEVPLFHSISPTSSQFPPSVLQLPYSKTVVTGSLSKAYSLAGIRVGWIASRSPEIIAACSQARDYTTISVSQLDDQVATYALSQYCVHSLLKRNINLAKQNLAILEQFVDGHRWACEWAKPVAGTTAFVKFSKMGSAIDDVAFCKMLMQVKGVLFCPGSRCFGDGKDFKGYVRIGFCCESEVFEEGLALLTTFMKTEFKDLPIAES